MRLKRREKKTAASSQQLILQPERAGFSLQRGDHTVLLIGRLYETK